MPEEFYSTNYISPIGEILIVEQNEKIIGAWLKKQKEFEEKISIPLIKKDNKYILKKVKKWLDSYFQGKHPSISKLSLAPIGTPFQHIVWNKLLQIPYGETITYGNIAKEIAKELNIKKMSNQAVGGAVGRNPIPIIIPCHRVIGANGNLTGYANGIDIKIKLLKHEGINMSYFFLPRTKKDAGG